MNELKDHEPFVEITVTYEDNGIKVKLDGARAVVLNHNDAQFLCDSLYVMLDEIDLEEREVLEEGDSDGS